MNGPESERSEPGQDLLAAPRPTQARVPAERPTLLIRLAIGGAISALIVGAAVVAVLYSVPAWYIKANPGITSDLGVPMCDVPEIVMEPTAQLLHDAVPDARAYTGSLVCADATPTDEFSSQESLNGLAAIWRANGCSLSPDHQAAALVQTWVCNIGGTMFLVEVDGDQLVGNAGERAIVITGPLPDGAAFAH